MSTDPVEVVGRKRPLDEAPLRKVHILATGAILGGAILDGYVLGIIGPVLNSASAELGLDALGMGLIAASALIGVFVGGLFFGSLADKIGRKPVFSWSLAAFIVLSLLQLAVTDVWQLVAIRLALGLAVGVEYAVGSSMLAEFSRRKGRGVLLGAFEVSWIIGFILAYIVGHYAPGSWRILLASSAIPAILTFIMRIGMPESPYWLHAQGRKEEAAEIVRVHFGEGYTLPEPEQAETKSRFRDLWTKSTWRPHLFAGLFWFCQVGPFFAIFTFLEPVFENLGIEGGPQFDFISNGIQLAGAFFGLYLLHRLTRRNFVIWTFALMFGALIILGLFPSAPVWLTVFLFVSYLFIAPAANNIERVYPAEIFPTNIRATGVGMAAAFSRIAAIATTYLLPTSMEHLGANGTLIILAVFPLVGLITSFLWAPETKGKQLH
ncbi:MFS transporter [Glutamicibacter sp. NPDC087344]|uniref:MFS transporter n=1 Tax=Glutamicibacter sp. NPDC087344 TaxID=3363994 RepID=UPI003816A12C